jgi:hypothetical protein
MPGVACGGAVSGHQARVLGAQPRQCRRAVCQLRQTAGGRRFEFAPAAVRIDEPIGVVGAVQIEVDYSAHDGLAIGGRDVIGPFGAVAADQVVHPVTTGGVLGDQRRLLQRPHQRTRLGE